MDHHKRQNVEGYDKRSDSFKASQLSIKEQLLLMKQKQPQVSTSCGYINVNLQAIWLWTFRAICNIFLVTSKKPSATREKSPISSS